MTTKNRERRNSFRRANCAPSGARLRRVNGLCSIRIPHAPAIKPQVCQLLFGTFSFWERKSIPFPFCKGTNFCKILSPGKILYFSHSINPYRKITFAVFCLEKFSLHKKRPFSAILSSKVSFIRKVRTIYVL